MKKTTPTSSVVQHRKSSAIDLFLVPETLFGMKAPQKQGVDAVQYGLLNMSEQEENVGADCLAHVFLVVLDNICSHFRNTISSEAARA